MSLHIKTSKCKTLSYKKNQILIFITHTCCYVYLFTQGQLLYDLMRLCDLRFSVPSLLTQRCSSVFHGPNLYEFSCLCSWMSITASIVICSFIFQISSNIVLGLFFCFYIQYSNLAYLSLTLYDAPFM